MSAAAGMSPPDTATPLLAVEQVSRWYGNVVAVNEISFALRPGITGMVGPNGAGKSTLLHMLAGFLRPSAGRVLFRGEPLAHDVDYYRHVGIVPEREALYDFVSGYTFVHWTARLHGLPDPRAAALEAIQRVEMEADMQRLVGTYSKGMKQRIRIAAAIVHDPDILLLDEPFSGTDPGQRLRLMDFLLEMAAAGRTILFSSHILDEMERLADTVLVVIAGHLAAAGNFHAIRRLMTDRPHTMALRSSDDRRLASALIGHPCVRQVEINDGQITVATTDLTAFAHVLPRLARDHAITVTELIPLDASLERVFEYLVAQ